MINKKIISTLFIFLILIVLTSTAYGAPGDVSVVFNGTTTYINAGHAASVNDIQDNAMTLEGWFKIGTYQSYDHVLAKGTLTTAGWVIYRTLSTNLTFRVNCATTNASVNIPFTSDANFHHVAMTFDDGGDRKVRAYLDGSLAGTSGACSGAIGSDSSYDLKIGTRSDGNNYYFPGEVGWVRISNNIRYSDSFTPQSRSSAPDSDGNTIRLFRMNEGTGTTITDSSSNAVNATLYNGTWYAEPTNTPTVTATATVTSTVTVTHTATSTSTATVTETPTVTATPTATATDTPTNTATATATITPTPTNTATNTPTVTSTPTDTPTPTLTFTLPPGVVRFQPTAQDAQDNSIAALAGLIPIAFIPLGIMLGVTILSLLAKWLRENLH